jgi:glyoxylase-like metal-dependent hydrolase (beta-lactamase superfamily II)
VQVFLPLPFKPTIINVYLVRAGDGWTLVDTGMHTGDSRRAMDAALAEHAIAPTDVTRIVCTHHHIDHYGNVGARTATSRAPSAPPSARGREGRRLRDGDRRERGVERAPGFPPCRRHKRMPSPSLAFGTVYSPAIPDALLADGDEIPLGDGKRFDVVWTPGHTAGHCCLLLQPDGILFVGDHLPAEDHAARRRVSGRAGEPARRLPELAREDQAPRRAAVCPAHGGVYEDHRRRASQLIDFHRVRKMTMLDAIRTRPLTPYEVALEAFAISPDNRFQVMAATSETLAHLELLRFEGPRAQGGRGRRRSLSGGALRRAQ